MFPGNTVVVRSVETASRTAAGKEPWLPARLPKRGEDNVGIVRVEDNMDAAGIFVFRQDFRPGLATVTRAKNPALLVLTEGLAQRRHEHNVGILGMNNERADLAAIFQSNILPSPSGIDRFINPS